MIGIIAIIIMGILITVLFGTMMVYELREKTDFDERVKQNRKK